MIWVVGQAGMLGKELCSLLNQYKYQFIGSDKETDITDFKQLENFAKNHQVEWIINCSAYTAVDKAEDETETAFKVNEAGVRNLAQIAKEKRAKLIHFSTDYIFDGKKNGFYLENDLAHPLNAYGKSKLAGETAIQKTLTGFFIIRSAWLYGFYGNNFVYTMLKLFKERDELRVVCDQAGSPTYTKDLAELILKIIQANSEQYGIYHFSNEGKTTWHEFACKILELAKENGLIPQGKKVLIYPIKTEEYPTKAIRPKNSLLSKDKVKQVFSIKVRDWQDALKDFINDLKNKAEQ